MTPLPHDIDTLLQAARPLQEPSGAVRERLRLRIAASVGVAAGVSAVASTASAAGAKLAATTTGLSLAMKSALTIAVAVAVGAGAAGTYVATQRDPGLAQPAPDVETPTPTQTSTAPALALGSLEPALLLPPAPSEPPPEPAALPSKPRKNSEPADRARSDTLDQERALLDQARAALAGGRGSDAARALDAHRTQFPRAALAEERAALRVKTWSVLGKPDAAQRAAAAFKHRYPRSLYLRSVTAVVTETEHAGQ